MNKLRVEFDEFSFEAEFTFIQSFVRRTFNFEVFWVGLVADGLCTHNLRSMDGRMRLESFWNGSD